MGNFLHSNVIICLHESSTWRCCSGSGAVQTFRESQSWMSAQSPESARDVPGQMKLLGQAVLELFGSTELLLRPHKIEPWAKQGKKPPDPNIRYLCKIKTWLKGAALLPCLCDVPQMGSQTKILLFWCTKQFQYPPFHWVMEIQIRPWFLNGKHQLYILHFKPTGKVVGSLLEKCIKLETKNQILFQGHLFFRVQTCQPMLSTALQSQALEFPALFP